MEHKNLDYLFSVNPDNEELSSEELDAILGLDLDKDVSSTPLPKKENLVPKKEDYSPISAPHWAIHTKELSDILRLSAITKAENRTAIQNRTILFSCDPDKGLRAYVCDSQGLVVCSKIPLINKENILKAEILIEAEYLNNVLSACSSIFTLFSVSEDVEDGIEKKTRTDYYIKLVGGDIKVIYTPSESCSYRSSYNIRDLKRAKSKTEVDLNVLSKVIERVLKAQGINLSKIIMWDKGYIYMGEITCMARIPAPDLGFDRAFFKVNSLKAWYILLKDSTNSKGYLYEADKISKTLCGENFIVQTITVSSSMKPMPPSLERLLSFKGVECSTSHLKKIVDLAASVLMYNGTVNMNYDSDGYIVCSMGSKGDKPSNIRITGIRNEQAFSLKNSVPLSAAKVKNALCGILNPQKVCTVIGDEGIAIYDEGYSVVVTKQKEFLI